VKASQKNNFSTFSKISVSTLSSVVEDRHTQKTPKPQTVPY